jgi:hypothetical protein
MGAVPMPFRVRVYHLDGRSLLFQSARRDEYEVEGSWVDADSVCDNLIGGCTVIVRS